MQFRNTSKWAIAGAVAAMLAVSTAAVQAQAPDSTMPMTDSTAPMPGAGSMDSTGGVGSAMSGGMDANMSSNMKMDYSILSNRNYDYVDLQQAKAHGYSDSQVASIATIAAKSGYSFRTVLAAVDRGESFPMLASKYNLRIGDVYSNDKEKQEIANYMAAYESIESKGGSGGSMSMMGGDMMAKPMDTMPMAEKPMGMSSKAATMDIVETAMSAKNLTTLVKALQSAGLVDTLKGAGPFTVFAPDDKAFSKLPAGTLDALMADPAKLTKILTYHVIPAEVMAADAKAMTSPTSPPTVEGDTLQVTKGRKGKLMVNDATVTKADIKATNGVIHIIDKVLMPPMDNTMTPMTPDTMTPMTPDTMTPMTPDTMTPMTPTTPDTTMPDNMTPVPPQ